MKSVRSLILASQSPQRLKLLKKLRVPFRVVPARVSENYREKNPLSLVLRLALRKASHVARRHPDALVLGADTVVACRGRILLKPRSAADARRMLSILNGRWHRVYTGVALVDPRIGKSWREAAVSRVKAKKLEPAALARLAGKHLDKSGAYAVQDRQDPFIAKIVGNLDNVIGLPLASVRNLLRKAGHKRGQG